MKVLFVDSWTQGIRMFLPIHAYLEERGINSLLVHYGSWDAEPGRPREERIEDLLVRDISYYRTRLLHTVFQREQPDCVISLTTNNLIDRAKILAARSLGIPSVFLMHGILSTTEAAISGQVNVLKSTLRRKRFSKIPKHLTHIVPNYFTSGARDRRGYLFTAEPYRVLFNTFRQPERWKNYPDPSRELQCDHGLAWGQAYGDFLTRTFGYDPSSIQVVGHPPLDKACRLLANPPTPQEQAELGRSLGIPAETPAVLYIEGAFAYSGYEGWNSASLEKHLVEIAEITARAGCYLIIKLHPSTQVSDSLQQHLAGKATLVQKADSERLICLAESVIGHSSTLINSAIVLDKPVFIPRWDISQWIPANFDDIAPVHVCQTAAQLESGLQQPENSRRDLRGRREDYLSRYLAPLDGRSQQRIGEAIERIASSAHQVRRKVA